MTTNDKKIKIVLSERAPVTISEKDWPVIAKADAFGDVSGGPARIQVQANQEWFIKVREHRDGRRLVYGSNFRGNGGMPEGWKSSSGGFLLAGEKDMQTATVRAIRRVAGIINNDYLADETIAELPSEEI